MIKSSMLFFVFIIYGVAGFTQQNASKPNINTSSLLKEIDKSFIVLDSLSNISEGDNIAQNGIYYINFFAKVSGIAPSSDGTFFGYLYCTKLDLKKWHSWYDKKYLKKIE